MTEIEEKTCFNAETNDFLEHMFTSWNAQHMEQALTRLVFFPKVTPIH